MDTVFVTLPLAINETLKWLPSSIFDAGGILNDDSVTLGIVSLLPHLLRSLARI